MSALLIDIGNTRIKWALFENGCLGEQAATSHTQLDRERLIAVLTPLARPKRVLIANVGGEQIGELLTACINHVWNIEPTFVHSTAQAGGLRNAYRDPAKLGVDRWLAAIGAHAMERRAVCVVSVGTAMTIDGVAADGRHLGGVITPGPDLMASSLYRSTSDIALRAQQGETTLALFANNTRGAVEQGGVHALAALIERAAAAVAEELQETPALLLTGGAAARLEKALRMPFDVVPDLVLRGLAVLAAQPG